MDIVNNLLYCIISYLIGSIPSGLIIGKGIKKIDIREHGSGNLGATNAVRVLGLKLGLIVLVMDFLKGGIPILLAQHVFKTNWDPMIFGIFAVLGHVFPLFARFKGGKAVATSGGVLLFFQPIITVIGLIAFAITLIASKMVSLSSTMAAITIFTLTLVVSIQPDLRQQFFGNGSPVIFVFAVTILFLFILIRHIPNYKRIINGTENKIGKRK